MDEYLDKHHDEYLDDDFDEYDEYDEYLNDDFERSVRELAEELSPCQQAYFAWLCAVRVLPIFSTGRRFSYWREKKQAYLNHIFFALDICSMYHFNNDIAITNYDAFTASCAAKAVSDASHAAENAAVWAAINAVSQAAYVVAYVLENATGITAHAAANAVRASYYTSEEMRDHLHKIILSDLKAMRDNNPESICGDTSIYGSLWKDFLSELEEISCAYWARQYKELFDNNFVLSELNKKDVILRLEIPDAIFAEGAAAVAKHMESIAVQGEKETKEARIILLGSKGAGKTSLAKKLHDVNSRMPRKSESTAGVDTSKLALIPDETTHLWDFGGHVIAQAAHKCFMSAECVYVIVIDGRTEQQLNIDEHRKWLSAVQTYSEGRAKVFMLLNISDENKRKMPEKKLKSEFPGLIEDFYTLNIKKDMQKLLDFKSDIKKHIEKNFVRKLPARFFEVKEELERQFRKWKKEILDEEEVGEILLRYGLEDNNQAALKYFNWLGVALRYDDIPGIVLNPTWISNGIYTIINHMQNNDLIEMHLDDIPMVFKGKGSERYNPDNCELLYNLMVKYELAFEVKSKPSTLLVPAVLQADEPDGLPLPKGGEETRSRKLGFRITFADNIFPRFVQRSHEHIKQDNSGNYVLWLDGMLLEKNKTYARITKETREIEITTWGENKDEFINELYENLVELLEEHRLQWERDEIKLPTGYVSADTILRMHHEGTREHDGVKTNNLVKVFNLFNINKRKITNTLANVDFSAGIGIHKPSKSQK